MDDEAFERDYYALNPCKNCGAVVVPTVQIIEDGDPFCEDCWNELYGFEP